MNELPFEMIVWNKNYERQQQLGAPAYANFTPRWRGSGSGEFAVDADARINRYLQTKGARLTCWYRGEHLISGRVRARQGPVRADGTVIYQLRDDYAWTGQTLGWVMPAAGAHSSGHIAPATLDDDAQAYDPDGGPAGLDDGSGYYPWPTDVNSAETAIKRLIAVNFTRLGRPYQMAPDLGRGGNARAAGMLPLVRMDPLDEVLGDLLDWSGLGLRIWQQPGDDVSTVDVWTPKTWTQNLSVASGIIPDGTYDVTDPEATRIVLGSNGDDAARAFWSVNDTTGLEDDYGDIIEVFRDATGAQLEWSDDTPDSLQIAKYYLLRSDVTSDNKAKFLSYLNSEGAKALATGRPTSGLNISLAETPSFHFHGDGSDGTPAGFHVGDQIAAILTDGQAVTERITECTVSWSAGDDSDGAFKVSPQVGPIQDDPTAGLAQAIAALAAAQRRIQAAR